MISLHMTVALLSSVDALLTEKAAAVTRPTGSTTSCYRPAITAWTVVTSILALERPSSFFSLKNKYF
jgi:hypothetical protein